MLRSDRHAVSRMVAAAAVIIILRHGHNFSTLDASAPEHVLESSRWSPGQVIVVYRHLIEQDR